MDYRHPPPLERVYFFTSGAGMEPDTQELKHQLEKTQAQLATAQTQLVISQITAVAGDVADHERRLRPLEDTNSKINLLLTLTIGGGALQLAALIYLFSQMKP